MHCQPGTPRVAEADTHQGIKSFSRPFFELKLNTIATLLPSSEYVHLCNIVFRVCSVKPNDNILTA